MHTPPTTTPHPLVMPLVLLLLAGCAHHDDVTQAQAATHRAMESARTHTLPGNEGLVRSDRYHLTRGTVRARTPAILSRHIGAPGLHAHEPVSVSAFAAHLSEHIGYPVDIAGDVYTPRESGGGSGGAVTAPDQATTTDSGRARSQTIQLPLLTYSVLPTERVASALSRLISAYGLSWSFDAGQARFAIYRYESAVFRIPSPNSTRAVSMVLNEGPAKTALHSEQAIASAMLTSVTALLSEEGRAEVSPSGVLVVSDAPANVAAIRRYVDTETLNLSRQVVISTRLYTYNNERRSGLGLDWRAVYANGDYAVDLSSAPSGLLGGVSGVLRRINPTSDFAGSNVNLDALATASDLSVLYASDLVTLSGFPVTTNDVTTTAYLKSVSRSVNETTGRETTTLEPGEINTGLALYYDPTVRGNDIYLSLAFSLTDLRALKEAVSGENRITTPEVSARDASQVVKLASGGAVALSGFQVTVAQTRDTGVGDARFKLLGGSARADSQTRDAVLVVMARIVE